LPKLMRTLHFDTELAWRGGQQQVLLLAGGLARRGVGVTLAAPAASALIERARGAGLPVESLAARGDLDPAAALRLARLLRSERFDLIHCHTAHAHGVALLGLRFLARAKRPKLVVSRRVAFSSASSFLTRNKFRGADLILAVSQAVREGLIGAGIEPARVAVVRDGIALDRKPVDPAERERIRRLFRLAPADRLVLHLAHLGAEKGQTDLIAAVPRIHAAVPNACIAIVGQGVMRERLERQAASLGTRIFFVGFWPPGRVPALLAAADVFVLPSRREGLGSVLFEAMAAGLPIAASRTGGIPEIVCDNETGLLVPPGDPPALADAVTRLLTDPQLSARLAAAALEFVRREGSAERMIDETLAAYRAMLDSRAS
jgi:glycosyltransferase involved in cell wall biosynthesis